MSGRRPHVLLVAAAVPPVSAPESVAVLKRLRVLARAADVTVLAADDPGDGFAMPPDPELAACLPDNVEIIRAPWPARRQHRVARTVAKALFTHSAIAAPADLRWASRAVRMARERRLPGSVDRVITNSAPIASHVVGMRLLRGDSRPWIQHYSDPFVDLTYRRYHPVSRVIDTRWERRLLRSAFRATVTSPETRALLVDRYAGVLPDLEARIAIVPNVYDSGLFEAAKARYGDRAPFARDGRLHAAYLGHFYGRRSIRPLCRWIDRRRARSGLTPLRVHVFGSLRASERALVAAGYADAIEIHPPVSYLRSLAIMAATDVLLVVDAPADGRSVHFPSKLADYLGAGRPIVAFTPAEGATARIAAANGHTVVPLDAPADVLDALELVLAGSVARSLTPPLSYANTAENAAVLLAT